jgi:hypothetical protein
MLVVFVDLLLGTREGKIEQTRTTIGFHALCNIDDCRMYDGGFILFAKILLFAEVFERFAFVARALFEPSGMRRRTEYHSSV